MYKFVFALKPGLNTKYMNTMYIA